MTEPIFKYILRYKVVTTLAREQSREFKVAANDALEAINAMLEHQANIAKAKVASIDEISVE